MTSRLGQGREQGAHWAAASVLSVGGHAAAMIWLLGLVPSFAAPPPRSAMSETTIVVTPAIASAAAEVTQAPVDSAEPNVAAAEPADAAQADVAQAAEAEAALIATADAARPAEAAGAAEIDAAEQAATPEPEAALAAPPSESAQQAAPPDTATPVPPVEQALAEQPQETLQETSPPPVPDRIAPVAETAVAVSGAIERLAAAPPQTLRPDPVTPDAVPPAALPAVELAPDALAAVPDIALGADAVPPVTLRPEGAEATVSAAVDPSAVLSSALPSPTAAPPRTAPQPQTPQDAALTALIERIRSRLDEACLVALPRGQAPPLGPLVTTLSDQDVTAARFAAAVLQDDTLAIDERRLVIDARQCPALTFLRSRAEYPAFGLRLALAQADLTSGETLVGRIEGIAGAQTALLLVDDNGVVQDLRRFLRFTGGQAEFAIPMTRDGPPRETSQILLAVTTPSRVDAISRLAGRLAADVFPALSRELPPGTRLAVQAIGVR